MDSTGTLTAPAAARMLQKVGRTLIRLQQSSGEQNLATPTSKAKATTSVELPRVRAVICGCEWEDRLNQALGLLPNLRHAAAARHFLAERRRRACRSGPCQIESTSKLGYRRWQPDRRAGE